MNPLRWLFELRDSISGPARKITRSLRGTRAGLDDVGGAIKPVETGFGGLMSKAGSVAKGIAGITIAVVALAKAALYLGGIGFFKEIPKLTRAFKSGGVKGLIGETGASFDRMGGRMFDRMGLNPKNLRRIGGSVLAIGAAVGVVALGAWGISAAFSAVFGVVSRVANAVAGLAKRFAETVISARTMRDQTVAAFATITGSGSEGLRITNEVRELAHFMGTDLRTTAKSVQSLMAGGFSEAKAFDVFQAIEDLRVIDPDASADNITRAIRQIQAKGVLQMEELQQQLADSGVGVGDVISRLGARLGISDTDVRKQISAGKVSAGMGIDAILESIQARSGGGALGALGRERSLSFDGLMRRMKNAPAMIFDAVAARGDAAFGSLTELLRDVNNLLDPTSSSFQSIVGILGAGFEVIAASMRTAWDIGRALFDGVFGQADSDPVEGVRDALTGMRDTLVGLRSPENVAFMRKLGAVLRVVAKAVWPAVKAVLVLGAVLSALGLAFATWVLSIPVVLVGAVGMIVSAVSEIATKAWDWGKSIIDGIVNGITGGIERLRTAATSIADTVKSAVTGGLKIASPSRVMEELGGWTGEGFARGLDATMPDLNKVASPPQLGGSGPYRSAAGRTVDVGGIHLEVRVEGRQDDPEGLADALRRILLPELEAAFEQLAIEGGVG